MNRKDKLILLFTSVIPLIAALVGIAYNTPTSHLLSIGVICVSEFLIAAPLASVWAGSPNQDALEVLRALRY